MLLGRVLVIVILCLLASPAFAQQRKSIAVPFETSNNIIIVQALANGSKPLSFILDTGAGGSVINKRRAIELGLKLEGDNAVTTGDGDVEAATVKNAEIKLSGASLRMNLTAIDLSGLEAGIGRHIDGILGYDVFARYVVEIDYIAHIVKLQDPKRYKYAGRGLTIPITIEDNRPFIRGSVAQPGTRSPEGRFEFDTGQVSAVILGETFTTQNRLLSARTIQLTTGSILAGRSSVRTGRIRELHIGGIVIRNPVTNFVLGDRGEADTTSYAGQIGGEILRRFRVVIDYPRKRVMLEPNRHLSDPFEFDMSGVSLAASGVTFDVIRVRALVEQSPATEPGLRAGDIITTINGEPTSKLNLERIRTSFRKPGQNFQLDIIRDGQPLRLVLTTRKLI